MADDGIRHEQSSVIGRSGNLYNFSSYIPSLTLPHRHPCPIIFFPFIQKLLDFEFFFRHSLVTALVLSGANLVSRACSSRFEMNFLIKSSLSGKSILPRKNVGIGFYGRHFSHHKTRSGSGNKEAELREKINELSNLIIE